VHYLDNKVFDITDARCNHEDLSRNYITMKNDGGVFIIQTAGKKARILGCFLELNFNGNTCFRYTAGYFNRS